MDVLVRKVEVSRTGFSRVYPILKRLIDIVAASFLLLLTFPLMLVGYLAVILTSTGPGVFWSQRIGYDGKVFLMPKLRSMSSDSKLLSREIASPDDIKITPVGKFLRRTSIDELPQFWSVLKGDMSLIGPRPLLINDQAELARNKQPLIYTVKPGITGLAQVRGRNFVSPKNKSRYDMFYAQRVCLMLDAKIALKTVRVLFRPDMVL